MVQTQHQPLRKLTIDEFVSAWNSFDNFEDLVSELGRSAKYLSGRAVQLRRHGFELKRFKPNAKRKPKESEPESEPTIDPSPTEAKPGTPWKVEVMRRRESQSESLWHEHDGFPIIKLCI